MKRNLFAIGLLALSLPAVAQMTGSPSVLTHMNDNSKVFVGKGAILYNGGGFQLKNNADFENHGNVMLVASDVNNDVFRTLNGTSDQVEASTNVNFVNKLNEEANYASANTTNDGDNYTYGQLFIKGFKQDNIAGYVYQEHRNVGHGAYQQMALPFYKKTLNTLSTELGKTFTDVRWSMNEILKYNNANVVFDAFPIASQLTDPTGYYIMGNSTSHPLNVSTVKRTIKGRPFADGFSAITLQNAGNSVLFGTGGNGVNAYNEKYNTYVQDAFELQAAMGGAAWQGNFGKNIYQFGNPFLTNIDLRGLFYTGDINNIDNIYGIRVEQAAGTVNFQQNVGGGAGSFRFVTFDTATSTVVGDVDWLIVRPMSVFSIKLKNNNLVSTINFDNLRRFKYSPRTSNTYDVTAKAANSTNTVKQLGVIALDNSGTEIGRTYYVVAPNAIDGHSSNATMQVAASSTNVIGTFEEDPINGGYDNNYISSYWLYINEANEVTFKGKAIPGAVYDNRVKSLKFEIRESAVLVPNGTHQLSAGIGFYYKLDNGSVQTISQNQTVPINVLTGGSDLNLYYGQPNGALGTEVASVKASRTMVIFNPEIDNYIVRFDPNWKTASIKVYDMSGKLVLSKENVKTTNDFVIDLAKGNKAFVVSVISNTGEKVNSKIIR